MKNIMVIPLKTRNKATIWPTISLLGIYPKETVIEKDTRTPVFTTAFLLVIILRNQDQSFLIQKWFQNSEKSVNKWWISSIFQAQS